MSDKRPGKPRFMSSQRERFCQLIAFRGYTASEAYREAYDVSEDTKDETVHANSSRIRNDTEVIARIETLMRPAIFREDRSKEAHVANLRAIRDLAIHSGQLAVAAQTETNVGKVDGFYIDKHQVAETSLEDLVTGGSAPKHEKAPAVNRGSRNRGNR